MTWEKVRLGTLITHRSEFSEIEPEVVYRRCRVQTSARGVVLRDRVEGSAIKTKRQQFCRSGEFLVAEIDAKMGGYGLVPDELDGAIVSSHYFLYEIDQKRLSSSYLNWYSKTAQFFAQVNAQGSTNYAAIRPDAVLNYTITLPPIEEQNEITRRLDAISLRLADIYEIQSELAQERNALTIALIQGPKASPYKRIPFGKFAKIKKPDVLVEPNCQYQFAGVYSFGRGVFKGPNKAGSEFSYERLSRISSNDFIYPKLMAWEGALGVVPDNCNGFYVSPEFPVFSLNSEILYSEVVDAYFRHPTTWPNLKASSKGTNVRRSRLNPSDLQKHMVPIPPREVQEQIRLLVQSSMDTKQEHIRKELEALLPAMLHDIFERKAALQAAKSMQLTDGLKNDANTDTN